MSLDEVDIKPQIINSQKSSMEILSELFSTFDAKPPLIIKQEILEEETKQLKRKKKHKHKEKKKKKKSKKRDSSPDSNKSCDSELPNFYIKQEKNDSCEGKKEILLSKVVFKNEICLEKKEVKRRSRDKNDDSTRTKKRKHESRTSRDDEEKRSRTPHDRKEISRNFEDKHEEKRSRQHKDDYHKSLHGRHSRTHEHKDYDRRRNGSHSRHRERSCSTERSQIDKKKLLEIARKNAIQMMKAGSLPTTLNLPFRSKETVLAAIKAGGKTVEELTDFCKTLSRTEELGNLSDFEDNASENETDTPFHHPFQIKDRPASITMNIKNSVPLPIKTVQERTSELRLQFPVSSGQQHRSNEQWIPVEAKKPEIETTKTVVAPIPKSSTPAEKPVFTPFDTAKDIGSIVSQRLTAMRKLQENPHDVQALTQMYKSTKEVQSWAESKQVPGQFIPPPPTVSTLADITGGCQAWAKKDQLQVAAPVSGGMGMHLLQKMGWKPGEGLGKEKTGALEPLLLEVKLDKKGLVANEEQPKKRKNKFMAIVGNNTQVKHPVSLLGEYACKIKCPPPQYELCFESGPDHKKNFLFRVLFNGVEYKPNVACLNKKEAKMNAANLCLRTLGIIQ